jgi:hypothetical protein
MSDRTAPRDIPDLVDIHQAAVLARGGVFVDGQRIGTVPGGWPVYCRHGVIRVDMRAEARFS